MFIKSVKYFYTFILNRRSELKGTKSKGFSFFLFEELNLESFNVIGTLIGFKMQKNSISMNRAVFLSMTEQILN